MGTPLANQANAVMSALQEGAVVAVIQLYESGVLGSDPTKTTRDNIMNYLTNKQRGLSMSNDDANYWLDYFHIDG